MPSVIDPLCVLVLGCAQVLASGQAPELAPTASPMVVLGDEDLFGSSACALGDVDGDGVCDVLVGAPRARVKSERASGVVAALSGSDGRLLRAWSGAAERRGYGGEFAAGPVVDGVAELAIAALGGGPGEGAVEIRSGRGGEPRLTLIAESDEWSFGRELAFVPDLDGDGRDDLAVFAARGSSGGRSELPATRRGTIGLYSTGSGERIRTLEDARDGNRIGPTFKIVSDLDGDGRKDLLVASAPPGSKVASVVTAFSTRSLEALFAHRFRSSSFSGEQALAAGDFNGDGRADFAVVVEASDGSSRVALVTVATQHEFAGDIQLDCGDDVVLASIGDVDRDGATDLIVARRGLFSEDAVRLYSGRTRKPRFDWSGTAPWMESHHLGASVAALGDVDADGVPDVLLGDVNAAAPAVPGCVDVYSGKTGALVWRQTLAAALAGKVHTPRR